VIRGRKGFSGYTLSVKEKDPGVRIQGQLHRDVFGFLGLELFQGLGQGLHRLDGTVGGGNLPA
jgi:hypothetical protein